jgi:ABC-2 type transport system ATP-binding protein
VSVIQTNKLTKDYGAIRALHGVSLTVNRGEIFGLLGQNGAGKTTLIKILLGVISSTEGNAEVLGKPVGISAIRKRIGYLPEDHRFPDYHTGYSLLDFYGALLEVPASVRRRRIPEVLDEVGIARRMHTKVRTYSKGMKQRLGIAQAMLHEPELIFMDEPTDGVDPVGRREIRELMHRLKEQGCTIFVNSHLLGEVELFCDRVVILNRGEIVQEGDIASLTKQKGHYVLGLAPGELFPAETIKNLGYRIGRDGDLWTVDLAEGQTIDPVTAALNQQGLRIRHLVEKRQTLEDLFIQTVEAAEPGTDDRRRPAKRGSFAPSSRRRGPARRDDY